MKEGEPVSKELNERYFNALREGREWFIYTGFRVWQSNSESAYINSADAGGVSY